MRVSNELRNRSRERSAPRYSIPDDYCDALNDDVPIVRRPICSMMR
jgi:hypothetical protein